LARERKTCGKLAAGSRCRTQGTPVIVAAQSLAVFDDGGKRRSDIVTALFKFKATLRICREALGLILYTDYVHYFQIAGMVLLVAMIGAIILTFRSREGIKKQDVAKQVGRKREEGYELVDIKPGQGLS